MYIRDWESGEGVWADLWWERQRLASRWDFLREHRDEALHGFLFA